MYTLYTNTIQHMYRKWNAQHSPVKQLFVSVYGLNVSCKYSILYHFGTQCGYSVLFCFVSFLLSFICNMKTAKKMRCFLTLYWSTSISVIYLYLVLFFSVFLANCKTYVFIDYIITFGCIPDEKCAHVFSFLLLLVFYVFLEKKFSYKAKLLSIF